MRIDHIGIAVRSIEAGGRLFGGFFTLTAAQREDLPAEHVRVAFFDAGNTLIELLEPVGDQGPLARFLATRGEGIHHIAFEVADIHLALEDAGRAGLRLIDARPRRGSRGRLIAFLHPRDMQGVLVELVQVV